MSWRTSTGSLLLALAVTLGSGACAKGTRITRYADGTVWAEIELVDGIPEGTWNTYHPNGERKSAGEYRDSRRVGQWLTWFEGGTLHSRGTYIEGRHDGRWEYWFSSGKPASRGTYADGHLVGTWRWWYGTGALRSEMTYDTDGQPDGLSRKYWPGGGIELETRFLHGLKLSERATAEDGRVRWEGAFDQGERVGPWRTWFRDDSYNAALSGIYEHGVKVRDLPETPTGPEETFEL